jgi:hypothetical protein
MKQTVSVLALVLLAVMIGLAQTPADTTQKPAAAPAASPELKAEIQICTAIADHQPTGAGTSFDANVGQLYCWSKITGANTETTVKHVWLRDGKEMASVELPVKSVAWRTYSQKKIMPSWTGDWEVKVLDASGNELGSVKFTVNAEAASPAPEKQ